MVESTDQESDILESATFVIIISTRHARIIEESKSIDSTTTTSEGGDIEHKQ